MTWTTSHNKAAVHGLISQPVMAYVGYIRWQLLVVALLATCVDSVSGTSLEPPVCSLTQSGRFADWFLFVVLFL